MSRRASSRRICRTIPERPQAAWTRGSPDPTLDPLSEGAEYDPQSSAISSAYVSLFNQLRAPDLKYGEGQTYLPEADFGGGFPWDLKHNGNPAESERERRDLADSDEA